MQVGSGAYLAITTVSVTLRDELRSHVLRGSHHVVAIIATRLAGETKVSQLNGGIGVLAAQEEVLGLRG